MRIHLTMHYKRIRGCHMQLLSRAYGKAGNENEMEGETGN